MQEVDEVGVLEVSHLFVEIDEVGVLDDFVRDLDVLVRTQLVGKHSETLVGPEKLDLSLACDGQWRRQQNSLVFTDFKIYLGTPS